jgi:hypothetical protein
MAPRFRSLINPIMRKLFFLISTTLITCRLFAQSDGLIFTSSDCQSLFDMAKAQGKGSMIYFFEEGNRDCVEMEAKVFTDPSVMRFISENFESIRMNKTDPSCAEMIEKAKLQFFPSILFFDEFGKLSFKVLGSCPPEDMISSAKRGLGREPLFNWYKKEYEAGNRDKLFLYHMCYSLRDANEISAKHVTECLTQYSYEELRDPLLLDFIYEFAVVANIPSFTINDPAFRLMLKERPLFTEHIPIDQVEARMVYIIQYQISESLKAKNLQNFTTAYNALREFRDKLNYEYREMDGRVSMSLSVDPEEEEPEKAFKKALKALEKMGG